jgi:hypothetical protein
MQPESGLMRGVVLRDREASDVTWPCPALVACDSDAGWLVDERPPRRPRRQRRHEQRGGSCASSARP